LKGGFAVSDSTFRKITGFMFILSPLTLFLSTVLLGKVSGFPDVQAQGVDACLRLVAKSGLTGILAWYAAIVPGILYIAAMGLFQKIVDNEKERRPWFLAATAIGVCAWALQLFGVVRWIFVFPYLADLWVNNPSEATKEAVTVTFNAFNNYAGFAIGQTVGIHLTAVWIFLAGIAILTSRLFKPWMGWLAFIIAIGEVVGNIGPLGSVIPTLPTQTYFNISNFFWLLSYIWMAYLGVIMMRAKIESREVAGGLPKPAVA
jgi:hypothetical protein